MTWLVLSVLSALFLGIYDVAKKASVDRNAVLPVLFGCSLAGLLALAPGAVLSWKAPHLAEDLGVFIPPLSCHGHALLVAKAGIVTLSWVLTFFALKHLPISLAAPIRASAPLFVLLGAIVLFGEKPSAPQWLGIMTIVASYVGFSVIGRAEGIVFEKNRWVWMLFAGTLVGAISGLFDKHLLQTAHLPPSAVQFYFTLYNTLLQGGMVLLLWVPQRRKSTPFVWRSTIVAVGILLLLADNLYFRALAQEGALVSVVSVIRRANVVISFGVGALAFREHQRRKKAGALAGILVGVALLLR